MKFLIDAQLPRRFCSWLAAAGHDAVHTLDLPKRNRTTDEEILELAAAELLDYHDGPRLHGEKESYEGQLSRA